MLSRVADSLYWLSLNLERADNMTKLLSVRLVSLLENNDPTISDADDWKEIIAISANEEDFNATYDICNRSSVIDYIAFSKENANSIRSCVAIARENAKGIREMIPLELWEVINDLYIKIKAFPTKNVSNEQLNDFFQMILGKSFLIQGIIYDLMPRGDGYHFLMFGKYVERLRKLSRTLDVYYHKKVQGRDNKANIHYHYWISVLNSLGGYESYLQKFQAFIEPITVANYLIFDESLPRSAKYSVKKLVQSFKQLEGNKVNEYTKHLNERLEELLHEVSYESLEEIDCSLHDYFQKLQQLCDEIGMTIRNTYYLGEINAI
ncbi:alpha-E domain-containing protein [Bacillus suaedae]|uniref:Alpha-E domain-containing protein n=1 Tax=Halalkalibacter suaedae TaxID=2822140 RepID=A0A940WUA6_9BACI|nr:alpha-E domain-containing protein [Bacillus suaedae]MBP3952426.1 alpha-E domain-containing protein [Bacillus suaedae]